MRAGFVALVLCLSGLCSAQDRFPNVPARWYERMSGQFSIDAVIHDLFQARVVLRPSWLPEAQKLNRDEQAVFIYAAYQTLIEPKKMRLLGKSAADTLADLRRATSMLEKELASIGVNVEGMKLHLAALARGEGFPDVPPKHWASKATAELKKLGLLKGYPDGLFLGRSLE